MPEVLELKEKLKNLRVLFVDDEEDIRSGTGIFLKKFFDHVAICENGQEGLEYTQNNPVDIVITDVMMPIMDGPTMLAKIKENNKDLFSIYITAFRDSIEERELADMHINKPLSYDDMVLILKTIAKRYSD